MLSDWDSLNLASETKMLKVLGLELPYFYMRKGPPLIGFVYFYGSLFFHRYVNMYLKSDYIVLGL